jgi:DNA invertase Pin-like site-specific DNA recombinase
MLMRQSKPRRSGDPLRVVGYVRVSSEDQTLGPVAQRHALEAWVRARGAALVAVHEDLGLSGGAGLEKRPGLLATLDALREHGAGVLFVAKRDRLARDVMVAAMVERLAARVGASVVSAAGEGEGNDPASQLMRTIVDGSPPMSERSSGSGPGPRSR